MKPCAVVIPCYQEAHRLNVDELVRLARHPEVRLVCVDDGSTDGTAEVLQRLQQRAPESVIVLHRERNGGRGHAVRDGMLCAIADSAERVGFLDADLAAPVDEMMKLLGHDAEMVLGVRPRTQRSPVRKVLGALWAELAARAIAAPFSDIQCGAKLFRVTEALHDALHEPFRASWTFDVELLERLHRAHVSFIEVPLAVWSDVPGSKLRPHHAARALFDLALTAAQRR